MTKDIVDVIIGEMLFDRYDVYASLTGVKALKVFKPFEDADLVNDAEGKDVDTEDYDVKIASSHCSDLALGYIFCGCSFCMASRLVDVTKSVSETGCSSTCMEGK